MAMANMCASTDPVESITPVSLTLKNDEELWC